MARGSSSSNQNPAMPKQAAVGDGGTATSTGQIRLTRRRYVSDPDEFGKPEPIEGYRMTNVRWAQIGGGVYEVVQEYESAHEAPGLIEGLGGEKGRMELDISDEMMPIDSHPNIIELRQKYPYQLDAAGNTVFLTEYSPGGSSGLGAGKTEKSPMAGIKFWSKPSGFLRHTFQTSAVDDKLWDDIGRALKKLPGGFPVPEGYPTPGGKKIQLRWLVMAPQIHKRGGAFEVTRTYKLLVPGAPKELYNE